MRRASLTKKIFSKDDLLKFSVVRSIIIMVGVKGGMEADVVLEEWLRVLHLVGNSKSADSQTEGSLSKRDPKACPQRDTLPPTRPYLLIVPLLLGTIFLPTSTFYSLTSKGE